MLVIIQWNEEKLLSMRFEEILLFFSELPQSEFFTNRLFDQILKGVEVEITNKEEELRNQFLLSKVFVKKTNEIHISRQLLRSLAEEYVQFKAKYNNL